MENQWVRLIIVFSLTVKIIRLNYYVITLAVVLSKYWYAQYSWDDIAYIHVYSTLLLLILFSHNKIVFVVFCQVMLLLKFYLYLIKDIYAQSGLILYLKIFAESWTWILLMLWPYCAFKFVWWLIYCCFSIILTHALLSCKENQPSK